jgi:hypothetical protein
MPDGDGATDGPTGGLSRSRGIPAGVWVVATLSGALMVFVVLATSALLLRAERDRALFERAHVRVETPVSDLTRTAPGAAGSMPHGLTRPVRPLPPSTPPEPPHAGGSERAIPQHPLSLLDGCSGGDLLVLATSLEHAMSLGAPLLDSGDAAACAQILTRTSNDLEQRLAKTCGGPSRALAAGRVRAAELPGHGERASAMRDTFDGLLAVIERKLELEENDESERAQKALPRGVFDL